MKNLSQIAKRLSKVIYILFLLSGLLIGWFVWSISAPYSYNTYTYKVVCNNGTTFDPTSKPIDKVNYNEPYTFNNNQVKAECEYGNSFYVGLSEKIDNNYHGYIYPHKVIAQTTLDQIKSTLIFIFIYYLVLEIIRRTFLYIFFGKSFLILSKKRGE